MPDDRDAARRKRDNYFDKVATEKAAREEEERREVDGQANFVQIAQATRAAKIEPVLKTAAKLFTDRGLQAEVTRVFDADVYLIVILDHESVLRFTAEVDKRKIEVTRTVGRLGGKVEQRDEYSPNDITSGVVREHVDEFLNAIVPP